jgi:hypothetical protein
MPNPNMMPCLIGFSLSGERSLNPILPARVGRGKLLE